MGELHAGGSTAKPDHIPTLEERVNTLSNQVILLISHFQDSANKSVEMAMPDDKVDGFLSPREEKEWKEAKKRKMCLHKFALPQPFDGTMKDTKSFVSSLILYIYGRKAEFPSNELKIMFALSYIQGGKAQYWKNEAINLIAAGQEPFKDFKDFIVQMEAQFGDLSPKATAIRKLKTLWQGSSSVDGYILQFKAKAFQTNLGDTVLVEYLKAGLNPALFKSIYWLPVMPETLKE